MTCKNCGRMDIPAGAGWCCWCGTKLIKSRRKPAEIKVPKPQQLPSGNWFIRLRLNGESIPITEQTERACLEKARAIKAGLIKEERAKSITLRAAIDEYIKAKSNVLSPSTIRGYEVIKKTRFLRYMDSDITKITQKQWQAAVNSEAVDISAKTLKNSWLLINTVLDFSGVGKVKVTLPQVVPHNTPFLTPDEIQKLTKHIKGSDVEIPILLGLSSLRRSETHALQWEDIDLKKRVIYVHRATVQNENKEWITKETNKNSSSNRIVPIMMDNLYEALKREKKRTGKVVELPVNTVRNRLKSACIECGITVVSYHGLRHSFASLSAHLGMQESVAMRIGGWANDKTMKRIYTHVLETDVDRYKNDMAEFYNKKPKPKTSMKTSMKDKKPRG